MTLVDSLAQQGVLIQSFWFTHYVCFCAILVVYIHTIQQHRQSLSTPSSSTGSPRDPDKLRHLFALAETCQQHLAEATRKNCPSRRYSIILEELRQEVHRQIGSEDQESSNRFQGNEALQNVISPAQRTPPVNGAADRSVSFETQAMDFSSVPGILQAAELGAASINHAEEGGFLENLEGSIWWAQLDSWVRRFFLFKLSYCVNFAYLLISWCRLSRLSQMIRLRLQSKDIFTAIAFIWWILHFCWKY